MAISKTLFAFHVFSLLSGGESITLQPPQAAPSTKPVDHGFVGLAFGGEYFPDYSLASRGEFAPIEMNDNLIGNIGARSGVPVDVRVGGTVFSTQTEPIRRLVEKQNPSGGIQFTLGQPYFKCFQAFRNVRYTWQVPLSKGKLETSVKLAKLGVEAIGNGRLNALEIGNEPSKAMFGSVDAYVEKWQRYASAISGNLSSLPSGPIFQGLGLRSETIPPFDIPTIFQNGIDKFKNLKTVSHHFYDIFPPGPGEQPISDTAQYLQNTLLNHQYTVKQTDTFKTAVQFLDKNHPNVPLILGEIGNALPSELPGDDNGHTQKRHIESSLATGIWTADFHLYCMSIGVGGISNQLGTPWTFSPWVPKPPKAGEPSIRPMYHGIMMAADFLGSDRSKPTRVRALQIPGSDSKLSAYASYLGTELSRVAILNLKFWDGSVSNGPRPTEEVTLELPTGITKIEIQRLTGPGAFAQGGVTWGGENWTYESKGKGVVVSEVKQTLPVRQGKVTFDVKATEAVIVSLRR